LPGRHLPVRPDAEQLRLQAEDLLRAISEGDASALADLREFHPKPPQPGAVKLADAQLVLARSYQAPSWTRLMLACSLIDAIWEDDVDTAIFYANVVNQSPTGADPALWGTNLHTFPLVEEAFALFIGWGATSGPVTLDLTAFDQSFSEFADTGSTSSPIGGDFPSRIWMAKKTNTSMTNDGVTATASDDAAAGNVTDGLAGMIGYAVLSNSAPVNMAPPTLAGIAVTGETLACVRGTWRNGPDSYSYQWERDGVDIAGATASAYTLTAVDEGTMIRCTVTSTNTFGSTSLNTSAVEIQPPDIEGDMFLKVAGEFIPVVVLIKDGVDWVGAGD